MTNEHTHSYVLRFADGTYAQSVDGGSVRCHTQRHATRFPRDMAFSLKAHLGGKVYRLTGRPRQCQHQLLGEPAIERGIAAATRVTCNSELAEPPEKFWRDVVLAVLEAVSVDETGGAIHWRSLYESALRRAAHRESVLASAEDDCGRLRRDLAPLQHELAEIRKVLGALPGASTLDVARNTVQLSENRRLEIETLYKSLRIPADSSLSAWAAALKENADSADALRARVQALESERPEALVAEAVLEKAAKAAVAVYTTFGDWYRVVRAVINALPVDENGRGYAHWILQCADAREARDHAQARLRELEAKGAKASEVGEQIRRTLITAGM